MESWEGGAGGMGLSRIHYTYLHKKERGLESHHGAESTLPGEQSSPSSMGDKGSSPRSRLWPCSFPAHLRVLGKGNGRAGHLLLQGP